MGKKQFSRMKMLAVIVIPALLMFITVIPAIVSASDNPNISVECSHEEWGDWEVYIEPTCQEGGLNVRKCKNCFEIVDEKETDKVGHRFTKYTTTEAPTCSKDGKEVAYCDYNCGASNTVTIPTPGHMPGKAVKENEKKASCKEEGSYDEVTYCTVCQEELSRATKEIPAAGHTPGTPSRENEKKASCTEKGSYDEVTYCTVCQKELSRKTMKTAKTGHTPGKAVKENEKKASCTEKGSYDEVTYCKICKKELDRQQRMIKKQNHHYSNYQSNNDAGCITDGTKTGTCTQCGRQNTVVDTNSRLGHDYTSSYHRDATCTGNEAEVMICRRCKIEISREKFGTALGHDFGDYTSNGDGTITAVCRRCNTAKTVAGITASSNGEMIIIPTENVILPLIEPSPGRDNDIFTAAYKYGYPFTGGTIDFSNTALVNADGDSVIVVLFEDGFKEGFYYTVAFSDGTVSAAGCVADGQLKISVPKKARGLGYLVMIGTPDSINVNDKDNNPMALAGLMRNQYETLSAECMSQLAKDTDNEYITPEKTDYFDQDIYESFKEGYISLRMKGWTHEDAYNHIKDQFEMQENGSQRFEPLTQNQDGNYRYCNQDQYGCWVTEEDGSRSYIMFWSEEIKNSFIGKDRTVVICDPPQNNNNRIDFEPQPVLPIAPDKNVVPAEESSRLQPAVLPIAPAETDIPAEAAFQSQP